MTYFEQVRHALAEMRRQGMEFGPAWARTMRQHPAPRHGVLEGIDPGTLGFAKVAFRNGYYGRDVLGGASILAEHEGWSGDHRVDGRDSANASVIA